MQRWRRISGKKRHSQIHREGTSVVNRLLVLRWLDNGLEHTRFAFVVSRRVGNAVARNRVKRRLREAVRSRPLNGGWDAVFIARRGIEQASFREVNRAAWNLLRRSKIADLSGGPAPPGGGRGDGDGGGADASKGGEGAEK